MQGKAVCLPALVETDVQTQDQTVNITSVEHLSVMSTGKCWPDPAATGTAVPWRRGLARSFLL